MPNGIDITSSLKSLDFVQSTVANAINYSINTVQSITSFIISFLQP